MKACIPIEEDRGLASRVHPHFGSAPMFLVVDTETRACRAMPSPASRDRGGGCARIELVAGEKVDLVLASGIGEGAVGKLRSAGLRVYRTARSTAGAALDAIGAGALGPVLADGTCAGRDRGSHGHGHAHGACSGGRDGHEPCSAPRSPGC